MSFRYLGEGQGYRIELPGSRSGSLNFTYETNGSDRYTITDEGGALLDAVVFLRAQDGSVRYTYTDLAFWIAGANDPRKTEAGYFVYGVPTDQTEIPLTGRGKYQAQVFGQTSLHNDVGGDATLEFDFAAGQLTGYMDPVLLNKTGFGFDTVLPRYEFTDTLYASGSTRFSGRFDVAGAISDSAFKGIFAGPGAAELMAQWYAPFQNPGSQEWDMMYGVWIGKRD
ncbi:hypothetical protein [Aurantiacibacter hainanensis]|uniref:hypothetical protein n=1 Tax=Aurantiacibacter hainanensis TaxID=3076114 RepID=UPI0030C777AC